MLFGFKVFYLKPTLNPTLETPISTWDPVGHDPVPIHTCVHTCAPCVNRQDPMLPRAELGLFPCQSTKDEPNSTTPTPRTQFFDPNPLQKGPAQQVLKERITLETNRRPYPNESSDCGQRTAGMWKIVLRARIRPHLLNVAVPSRRARPTRPLSPPSNLPESPKNSHRLPPSPTTMRLNPLTNTLQEPLPNPSQHPPDHLYRPNPAPLRFDPKTLPTRDSPSR